MKLIFNFLLLAASLCCSAQGVKIEQEKRLKKDQVPSSILEILEPYLAQSKRVRYFEETSEKGKSYEAKLIYSAYKFSIEFSEAMVLEDIEMIISQSELPKSTLEGITKELSSYQKAKIEKIQKQFSSTMLLPDIQIKNALTKKEGDLIRYELIVHAKSEGVWKNYEMLFEESGGLILIKEVSKRSSDFILY